MKMLNSLIQHLTSSDPDEDGYQTFGELMSLAAEVGNRDILDYINGTDSYNEDGTISTGPLARFLSHNHVEVAISYYDDDLVNDEDDYVLPAAVKYNRIDFKSFRRRRKIQ